MDEQKNINESEERSLIKAGQRRINILWEITQSIIALTVSLSTLYVSVILVLRENPEAAVLNLLGNAFFLVIGFYFGRTNHQRTGGVAEMKSSDER